jgi:pre-mRNA-splicing factor ATP-dependent RNA helicase DHX38/PRP16
MAEVQTEFDNEEEQRVTLIVHNLKPPFLDGRVRLSLQQDSVSTVKDLTSDFAQNARKGSVLLKDVREKREMMKMRKRFWELGGSRMGDAMGIAAPVEEEAVSAGGLVGGSKGDEEDDNVDYKDGSSFAKHMKGKVNEAQSQFAKSKSMSEQREYLPVYAVRDELLNIVRENQITVIVGETGSGWCRILYSYRLFSL